MGCMLMCVYIVIHLEMYKEVHIIVHEKMSIEVYMDACRSVCRGV